jgi:hypothetical protein
VAKWVHGDLWLLVESAEYQLCNCYQIASLSATSRA